jgi:hypothetical protein
MREKKEYTKPVLSRVEVRPDEAVLTVCKPSSCIEADPPAFGIPGS